MPLVDNLCRTLILSMRCYARHYPISTYGCSKLIDLPPHRRICTTSSRLFLDVRDKDHEKKSKQLIIHNDQYFDEAAKKAKNKETFQKALAIYLKRNSLHRRGHVEFLYAALGRMKEFNASRDLESYKKLLDLFPTGVMIPTSVWQVEFMHYPKQQQCCIDILQHMEMNGVIPDDDMGYQLREIFGDKTHAFRRYQRMMYWMPKWRYANPYYVPWELPTDRLELAKLVLNRMSVDLQNALTIFQSADLETALDHTYIVSAQSPSQSCLIVEHPKNEPIFVEGGFTTWLRHESLTYFVLRSDCTPRYRRFAEEKEEGKKNKEAGTETFKLFTFDEEPTAVSIPPSLHEQEDGTILAMCITGTSSKDSLASWIKFLERQNPTLSEIPVVFLLRTPESEVQVYDEEHAKSNFKT